MSGRIALGVEYDGTGFSGWQIQHDARTVQGVLEDALAAVADHEVRVICAGRTDAGVHARGQVVHFDSAASRTPRSWVLGANTHLPPDACVLWAHPVAADFHARYSAVSRTYRYHILTRPSRSALDRDRAWWLHEPLDAGRMRDAAARLVGEHDFSAFRSSACQSRTARRCVRAVTVDCDGQDTVITISANAFLHNMVRIVTGVLVAIGRGAAEPAWIDALLSHGDRTRSGFTAPPQGLYLSRVEYPASFGLPLTEAASSS